MHVNIKKFDQNPIIHPQMAPGIGDNINGPSLIKVPEWITNPLGTYYLYFSHHNGSHIRMAYADQIEGPWLIYNPGSGVLKVEDAYSKEHIASPDIHVDKELRQIWMYYHGCRLKNNLEDQVTRLAVSPDGLTFEAQSQILGACYWRRFQWQGEFYFLEMPGKFLKSKDGRTKFETGPTLFSSLMRHSAVKVVGNTLHVFYSDVESCPEAIMWSKIQLKKDWWQWEVTPPVTVTSPEFDWEGADCEPVRSKRWASPGRARQLRDPCLYSENGRNYLLYAVAGESGIALAELPSEIFE